jgi:predicted enzyme related to lactoylglutathione lyase
MRKSIIYFSASIIEYVAAIKTVGGAVLMAKVKTMELCRSGNK